MKSARNWILLLLMVIATGMLACDLIDDLAAGLAELCDTPEFVVTKTDDTNDGLCTADDCSLREAVVTANNCPGPNAIRLPAGHYLLDRAMAGEDAADKGDLDITDDLTITGVGAPSIDAYGSDRVFEVFSPAVVTFDLLIITNGYVDVGAGIWNKSDLTIRNSSIHSNHAAYPEAHLRANVGGGILNSEGASLTLIDTQIFDNIAGVGGGVANLGSEMTATNVLFTGNLAEIDGGGLSNQAAATASLNDVTFNLNRALENGGGIDNDGSLDLEQATFEENEAGSGAGIFNGDHLEFDLGSFEINIATVEGGGLLNDVGAEAFIYSAWFTNNNAENGGGVFNRGLLHLYQSGLNNNSGLMGFGAGIYNDGPAALLLLENVTLSGNIANPPDPTGGGLYNHGGEVDINFSTIGHNSPDGILNDSGGRIEISNSLIFSQFPNCTGVSGASGGYNIEDTDSCALTLGTDLVSTGPGVEFLAMNGGNSLSHAPVPGSPAVDSADLDRCISEDQRKMSRPQGVRCDRGSIELEGGAPTPTPGPAATRTPTATPLPPAAPAQLDYVNQGCDGSSTYEVVLSWVDASNNETGFRIYRDGQLIGTVGGGAETFTDQPPGYGPYDYGVEAYNGGGSSSRPTVNGVLCLF